MCECNLGDYFISDASLVLKFSCCGARKKVKKNNLLLFWTKKIKLLFETAKKLFTFEQNIPALIKKCEFAPFCV